MELVETKYKQTEIGLIPSDWEVIYLQDVADFASGTTPRREFHERYFVNGNNFWVKTLDLNNGKIEDTEEKVTDIALKETSSLKVFPPDTILIAMYGGFNQIGRTGLLRINACVNQAITAVKCDKNKISPNFILYYLNYQVGYWKDVATSSRKDPNITSNDVKKFTLPLPSSEEQTAIATALSDADNYISSLEKLITKKRLLKHGAMQQLLSPKEDWVVKKLGEVGEISGAGVDKKIREDEVPIRLVNYMDVFNRDFIYSNELEHWVTAKPLQAQRCSVLKGDIFFTPSSEMRFDIAISAVAMEDISDAAYSYHLVRLRLFDDWDINFRTYIFKQKHFLDQAETMCEGSGKRYVISLPKFREMEISYPESKEEQTRIATILSDMDAGIAALEKQLAKARSIKQGMMQQLLTGKIRLV